MWYWYVIQDLIFLSGGLFLGYFTLKSILKNTSVETRPRPTEDIIEELEEKIKDDIEAKNTIDKLRKRLGL